MTASPVNVRGMGNVQQLQATMLVLEKNLDAKVSHPIHGTGSFKSLLESKISHTLGLVYLMHVLQSLT